MSKSHGTIEVTLEYAGRAEPIPVPMPMTPLQARLREILSTGPMYPWDIYRKLWPGREPRCSGPSRGGPDSMSVAIHRMMGRKAFRRYFEQDTAHLRGGRGVCKYRNKRESC